MDNQLFKAIKGLVDDNELAKHTIKDKACRESFKTWAAKISETDTSNFAWKIEENKNLQSASEMAVDKWVYSTCGYCAAGCGLYIGVKDGKAIAIKGNSSYPVNRGTVSCIKGLYQWKTLHHEDRLTMPLIRKEGKLVPASWEEAISLVGAKMREAVAEKGPNGIGVYGSGQLLLEESYALGKLAKGVIGTTNVDSNLRLCMASAVEANIRNFGSDGPPGCFEDLDISDCIVIFGCNPAEMHPVIWKRILKNKKQRNCKIIAVDPRKTLPAEVADIHLQLRSGTNVALLNSIMHQLIKEDFIDNEFIENYTTNFLELKKIVSDTTPEWAEEICQVPSDLIKSAAKLIGQSKTTTTIYVQGVLQSNQGTEASMAINNMHLITGKVGKPGSAPMSITGQATSMSHREVGGSSSLPGYRHHQNSEHRKEVADFWGIEADKLPTHTNNINEILKLIEASELKVLLNVATNPAVSLPNSHYVRKQLDKVFLIVQDIYPNETLEYADVVLPAAQWGEKTGTYTNAERRVNLGKKAVKPPGDAKSDFDIVILLARELGAANLFPWKNTEDAFNEWKELSRGRPNDMTGMTYQRLEQQSGIQWPCPELNHSGTKRLYTDNKFNAGTAAEQSPRRQKEAVGKARIIASEYKESVLSTSEEYPFWLNTGRLMEHYHSRVKTKRIPELHLLSSENFVEINKQDAHKLGVETGDLVKVISPLGEIIIPAQVTGRLMRGQVFVPFHFGEKHDNRLQGVNYITSSENDSISKQPLLKNSVCRIEKCI